MANWKDYAESAKAGAMRLAAGIKQKNRRAAMLNRLRTVIRCQERAAEREYLALGRYYYNALRDKGNQITEDHCERLDKINALLDSTLGTLEKEVREQERFAASIGVIGGADGPTTIITKEPKKEGTLFHFGGGPFEITVTRDVPYRPEEEDLAEAEEIDLDDVESFDHDPMPEGDGAKAGPGPVNATEEFKPEVEAVIPEEDGKPEFLGAELTENDNLPFEG